MSEVGSAADEIGLELANQVLERAKDLVPVDTGDLRDSGQVVPEGDGSYAVEFTAPHAIYVHERTELHHAHGQAKFLEQAVAEVSAEAPAIAAGILADRFGR